MFPDPRSYAETVERISAAQNGMIILILIAGVVFAAGVFGIVGMLVRSQVANRKRQVDLEENRQKQDADREAYNRKREERDHALMNDFKVTFQRIATSQENAEIRRQADAAQQAQVVKAIGEIVLSLSTLRNQQTVNTEGIDRLHATVTNTFDVVLKGFGNDIQELREIVTNLFKEITSRNSLEKIEQIVTAMDTVAERITSIDETVIDIKRKVDTQEIPAVTLPALPPPTDEPKADES